MYFAESSPSVVSSSSLIKDYTKTALLFGLIVASSSTQSFAEANSIGSIYPETRGSDFYRILSVITDKNPTWSSVSTSIHVSSRELENINPSFELLKKLSFLEGDVLAEKEADAYFDSIPVKTRKVLVLNK